MCVLMAFLFFLSSSGCAARQNQKPRKLVCCPSTSAILQFLIVPAHHYVPVMNSEEHRQRIRRVIIRCSKQKSGITIKSRGMSMKSGTRELNAILRTYETDAATYVLASSISAKSPTTHHHATRWDAVPFTHPSLSVTSSQPSDNRRV